MPETVAALPPRPGDSANVVGRLVVSEHGRLVESPVLAGAASPLPPRPQTECWETIPIFHSYFYGWAS